MTQPNASRQLLIDERVIEFPPIVIADHLRTPENIGSIIRSMANIARSTLICIDDNELNIRRIRKTAFSSFDNITLIRCSADDWRAALPDDYTLVALETTPDSTNIFDTHLPSKLALVVGNEVSGISNNVLHQCTMSVHIPMTGPCKSMNVSHATTIALFEWARGKIF